MTNLELYKLSEAKLKIADLALSSMETLVRNQKDFVDGLNYETSELKSKLTDEELESLEVF